MMKRKYSALLAVAGAAVMLGGCNIYRPYSRPQMETAGLYRDTVSVTDTLSGDTVNFGNRPWQEVFTDPKLQSLIEQGLSSNIDLLSAALVVQEYQAQLTAARLAYVPSFTVVGSARVAAEDLYASAVGQLGSRSVRQTAQFEAGSQGRMASERGDAESRSHAGDLGHSYRLLYVADARPSVGNHRADDRELEPDRPDDESDEAGRQCQ